MNRPTRFFLVLILVLVALPVLSVPALAGPGKPSPSAILWANKDLGVHFYYPVNWQPSDVPLSLPTYAKIDWRLPDSGQLAGACFLDAYPDTNLSKVDTGSIHADGERIARDYFNRTLETVPGTTLISWDRGLQDKHPVISLVRDGSFRDPDGPPSARFYAMITSWNGYEINFECVTPIFGVEFDSTERGRATVRKVESHIKSVMQTIRFDR